MKIKQFAAEWMGKVATVPTQCPWTDKDRADARAAVVGHKRDARGRWVGGRKP